MWRNARVLKLDWWLGGVALLVVTSLALARCGGTGSDLVGFPEGDTFVNEGCNTDSACIRFSISPSRIPADGESQATFIATLLNADGTPAVGEQVCFFVEDTAAATIVEPVGDNCQLTNAEGRVSGRVQAGTTPVSVAIVARSFSRSLETQVTLLLGQAPAPDPEAGSITIATSPDSLSSGQTSVVTARLLDTDNQPIAGATIVFSRIPAIGSLSASSAVTGADGQASVTYTAPAVATDDSVTITAQSGTISESAEIALAAPTPTPVPTATPVCGANGSACTVGTDCCSLNCDPGTLSCVP